jgi:hypothetical protein
MNDKTMSTITTLFPTTLDCRTISQFFHEIYGITLDLHEFDDYADLRDFLLEHHPNEFICLQNLIALIKETSEMDTENEIHQQILTRTISNFVTHHPIEAFENREELK